MNYYYSMEPLKDDSPIHKRDRQTPQNNSISTWYNNMSKPVKFQ